MRTARFSLPGSLYHCIWRFVDRDWFFTAREERDNYLRLLGHALSRSDWRCLAYALMSNHIHLAVVAGTRPMSSWTKATNSPFARWMNQRHGRLGPLFADRAKDYQLERGAAGDLIAYIHNNPVRAGVVRRASQSDWTSHRAYAGLVRAPSWLAVDEGLARCGFTEPAEFDAWVDVTPGESGVVRLERQRRLLRERGSIEAGTPALQEGRVTFPVMARRSFHVRPDPHTVIDVIAELGHVRGDELRSRRRLRALSDTRRIVAHCASSLGLTPTETASALGISSQAVSVLMRKPLTDEMRAIFDSAIIILSPSAPPRRAAG